MRGMLSQVIEETMLKTEIDCGQPVFDESVKDITAFQGVRHFGETKCGKKDLFWSQVFAKKGKGECVNVMPCSVPVENYRIGGQIFEFQNAVFSK